MSPPTEIDDTAVERVTAPSIARSATRAAAVTIVACAVFAACQVKPKPLVVSIPGDDQDSVATSPMPATAGTVTFHFDPLRSLPYDGFSLPLVSPDGSRAAVQIALSGGWVTLVAGSEARVIDAGRIAVASLTMPCKEAPTDVAGNDLILGRSCDSEGFLVESPRGDGSRWIGKVAWSGAPPMWLVDDDRVNAFATLGPSGELAWSQRAKSSDAFDLVVKRGSSEVRIPAHDGASWYAPTLSWDGKMLFALRLRDGVLTMCSFSLPPNAAPALQSQIDLSWRANSQTAYQTIVPLRADAAVAKGGVMFFHPRLARIAIWGGAKGDLALTTPGTNAAITLGDGRMLCATARAVGVEPIPADGLATAPAAFTELVGIPWIPIGKKSDRVIVAHPAKDGMELALLWVTPQQPTR